MSLFYKLNTCIPEKNKNFLEKHLDILDEVIIWSLITYILILPFPMLGTLKAFTRLLPLVIWLIKKTAFPSLPFKGRRLLIPCSLYLLACLLSLINSPDILYSLDEIRGDVLFPMVICFLLINNISRPNHLFKLFVSFAVSSVIISGYGLFLYFLGKEVMNGRATLGLGYPTLAAAYLVPIAMISLGLYGLTNSKWIKILIGIELPLNFYALFMTEARTGLVAYVAAFSLFLWFTKKKMLVYLPVIFLVVILFVPLNKYERIYSIVSFRTYVGGDVPVYQRYYIWKMAVTFIEKHPIVGYGYGWEKVCDLLSDFHATHKIACLEDIGEEISHAHNIFLQIWLETGILGLISFIWLLLILFSQSRKYFKVMRKHSGFSALMVACMAFLIMAQMDNLMRFCHVKLIWIMIGLLFFLSLGEEAFVNHST